jgi:hypothetical protein
MLQVCFIWMLYMFHTYVASVYLDVCIYLQWLSIVFSSVLDAYFECFICLFYTLQVLHLDVLKVDRVLYMGCTWKAGGARAVLVRATLGQRGPLRGCG